MSLCSNDDVVFDVFEGGDLCVCGGDVVYVGVYGVWYEETGA